MEFTLASRKPPEKKWLVVYVRPRWEKKVVVLLAEQCIESFCPLRSSKNQWADRKKIVTTPLFTGYVFVRITDRDLTSVRYTLGILNYVYFMGKPAIIRDIEIEQLKKLVNTHDSLQVISLSELSPGDRIRIKNGLFNNKEGHVVQIRGKYVVMSLENLNTVIITQIPIAQVIKTRPENTLYLPGNEY